MKLLKQIVTKSLSEVDEAKVNQEFPIHAEYNNIILCAAYLNKRIPEDYKKNELYKKYQRARKNNDHQKIRQLIQTLKTQTAKDGFFIHAFLEATKNIDLEDTNRTEVYHPDYVGISSFEDN